MAIINKWQKTYSRQHFEWFTNRHDTLKMLPQWHGEVGIEVTSNQSL